MEILDDQDLLLLDQALDNLYRMKGSRKAIQVRRLETNLFQKFGIDTHGACIRADHAAKVELDKAMKHPIERPTFEPSPVEPS